MIGARHHLVLGVLFPQTLEAARGGAEWAWSSLYRDLAPVVLGYLRRRGADDPENLTGEVFVQVVRDLERFEGDERAFRAWVFVIAHHRLVDQGRRRARRSIEPRPDVEEDALGSRGADEDALESVAADRVRRLIGTLVPDQRDVLLLRVLGGLTVPEVAQALGKTPGAVKALQRRGLKAIVRGLEREGVSL